jgi:outer membrane protein assembly factor BamB
MPASAHDWAHWRGPEQSGVSREKGLPDKWSPDKSKADSNLIWKAPFGGRSTPLVMNGHIYLINRCGDLGLHEQERVMCFDANDGKVLWEHKFNVFFTDIVSVRLGWTNLAGDPETGNVYAHGTQGLFMCFNKDGKVLWERSLSEEYGRISGYGGRVTSPTVDGDLVIVGFLNASWGDQARGGNRYVAFDKKTGAVRWWSDTGVRPTNTFFSVPVVANIKGERLLIVGGAAGEVVAFRVRTGERVWTTMIGSGAINSSPVVVGNHVFIGHGEDNPGSNTQGAMACIDAGDVKDGKPTILWKKEGIKAKFASPAVHEGRVYIPDEVATLYCLDAKSGDELWKFRYGRNSKGSPVWADGKIYIAEVNAKFHILQPGDKSCKRLHQQFFRAPGGKTEDVELNGSPAIANGRVYFCTSEEMYCIGKKEPGKADPVPAEPKETAAGEKVGHLQVVPADVVLEPGQSAEFKVRAYDEHGHFIKEVKADFSLAPMPTPPPVPNAPKPPPGPTPPDLKGTITADGKLTVDEKLPSQFGLVVAKSGDLTGVARIRVAPRLPYAQDFAKVPDNRTPGGWVNTQGKFAVITLKDGTKAMKKTATNASPLVARANAYMSVPTLAEYTVQADVMGTMVNVKPAPGGAAGVVGDMPDVGVVASRYTFVLIGNEQVLRLISWDALPRIDKTIKYPWKPDTWYTMKITSTVKDGKAIARGKIWPRGKEEPKEWTLEVEDPEPNTHGAPALYANATGIIAPAIGSEGFFQNVKVTPNAAPGGKGEGEKKPEPKRNTRLDPELFGPAANEALATGWNDRSPRVPCRCNRCRAIR